jgi:hypothetical protein
MQLKNWVQERFGGTGSALLDDAQLSDTELKRDIYKLEHKLEGLEDDMNDHEVKYRKLLKKGAQASELKRETYAQKAELEKKKYAVKKKKYQNYRLKLGTAISVQGMREVMNVEDEMELNIDDAFSQTDAQEVQMKVLDQMADFGMQMDEMQEIQNALDIEIMDEESVAGEESETIKKMQRLSASEIEAEEISIEESEETMAATEATTDDIDEIELDEEVSL